MLEDIDILQLKRNPEWLATLQVYHDLQQELRESSPDADGWVPRPAHFDGIESGKLSSIHGKLIAYGFLRFDVAGRDAGVRYQLTPEGRRAVNGETEIQMATDLSESA